MYIDGHYNIEIVIKKLLMGRGKYQISTLIACQVAIKIFKIKIYFFYAFMNLNLMLFCQELYGIL